MTGTYGPKHKLFTPCATRTIIFQIESNLIVWFTQCASFFFFSTRFFFFANMFAVLYLWKSYVTKHRNKWQLRDRMTIKNKIVLRGSHVHSNFCPCPYTVARKVGSAGLKLLQIRFQDTLIQCLHGKSDRFVFAFSYIVIFNVQYYKRLKNIHSSKTQST